MAIAYGVQAEHERIGFAADYCVRKQVAKCALAVPTEGGWVIGNVGGRRAVTVIENREAGVEMVEAGIDEFEGDHRSVDDPRGFNVSRNAGAESTAGENHGAKSQEIAFAFIGFDRFDCVDLCALEPIAVGLTLGLALLKSEPCTVGAAADNESTVCGEDHVGKPRFGIDQINLVTQAQVGVAQDVPLDLGEVMIDRDVGIHPGIDGIGDGKVGGRTHQIVAWT